MIDPPPHPVTARAAARLALALVLPLGLACGETPRTSSDLEGEAGLRGEILVSAAASLTEAFTALAREFEAAHPGTEVTLNLAGSSALRAQILEGAPVDVYASANMANMDRIEAAGAAAGTPRIFAWNRLQIAVPRGNPAGVTGLADLAREELLVGLCAREVPCGTLARTALSRAGIVPAVDTEEPDVRALLTKVGLGELDAAVTYATDVAASDAVDGIAIPGSLNVDATYPVVVLAGAPNPAVARAFVDHVLSAAGRASLARFGFLVP